MLQTPIEYRILALYRFVPLVHPSLRNLKSELYETLRKYEVRGTLLLAPEGINGTICYPVWKEEDDENGNTNCDANNNITTGESVAVQKQPQPAFQRLKIKIKAEIVTMGLGPQRHLQNQKANPLTTKGQYLTPSEWDKLCICNPNVLVIDTRNTYEIDIGTFETAVDPKTKHFAEFPQWLDEKAGEYDWKIKTIAMFCTGGIRCEKATSYALQSKLFPKDVPIYHLEGGILAYLDYSTFRGECFVFDKRVSVTEGLKPSKNFISCYGCRITRNLPTLRYDSQTHQHYLPGLTCPRCHGSTTKESLERFAARKEQMEICSREGKEHFRDGKKLEEDKKRKAIC
ncbi:hypothetical protein THAPSDRAFT_268136 [Thalassiosira pseudonana CCMP1335]|uniref:Rhodanese domain-containing protein n=1 Tax=Thalassiosira pseudonana TaxID=35128 RepID=B8BSC4_THAPS|nr:hypothetical protein THAPSDRAFT_268136 [Thalassiosira pseudonana CCMP1335]EED96105.1 hypothetical protein THAPSDRAFT_268136 [Thalassiosira pseudonana CCMP1335]